MPYLLNLLYLLALLLLSPWLVYKALTTGKYRRGLSAKFLGRALRRNDGRPCVWFHGVSVGEVLLLRPVVAAFRSRHPECQVVISATTDTGLEEARKHFADLPIFAWPLDFSWAVRRALATVQPQLVVLAESELWPNFLWAARRAGVKVAVINGRMSPRSSRRFRRFGLLLRPMFRRVDLWAMQTEEYAEAVRALGVAANVHVSGNVKYDGVATDRHNSRTEALGALLGRAARDLVWIAGSTQAPEEEIVLQIFQKIRGRFPALRLILVPRQRERFAQVADLLQRAQVPFVRRSQLTGSAAEAVPVVLVDTIGELGAIWGLADVAFVGGSLDGQRGGQNMIEPAAYGAAVLFGPHVWNVKDAVARLLERQAAVQVADAAELERQVVRLLLDPALRQQLGQRARELVESQHGATARTVQLLATLLDSLAAPASSAA